MTDDVNPPDSLPPLRQAQVAQTEERIPDRFRELQWTRLIAGETPPAFVERVSRLLSQTERTGPVTVGPDQPREHAVSQQAVGPSPATATQTVWARIKAHRVLEWTLAYAAAAYTLLHVVEMAGNAFDWPHAVARNPSMRDRNYRDTHSWISPSSLAQAPRSRSGAKRGAQWGLCAHICVARKRNCQNTRPSGINGKEFRHFGRSPCPLRKVPAGPCLHLSVCCK